MKKLFLTFFILCFAVLSYATTIYDIQYTTDPGPDNTYPSPLDGQTVTVEGIVTGLGISGYVDNLFITDPEGGPWHGIYVYACDDSTLALGDMIEVTGEISEYYGYTEFAFPTETVLLSSGHPVPDPMVVTCADLAPDGVGEQYESCLVQLNNVTVVEEQISFGQWYVTDGTGIAQIDDGFFYLDTVEPPIVITLGMQWGSIIGVVDYSYDEYGINPRIPEDLVPPTSSDNNFIPDQPINMSNYPNPFNPETTITYELKESETIELSVYSINGQKIKTLVKDKKPSGRHIIMWDGTDDGKQKVTSGLYFYKLSTDSGYSSTKKMILLK